MFVFRGFVLMFNDHATRFRTSDSRIGVPVLGQKGGLPPSRAGGLKDLGGYCHRYQENLADEELRGRGRENEN